MTEGSFPKVDGNVLYASEVNTVMGLLGQIIQVDISRTGALSKANLQAKGWAICDGTTPSSQGISSPTITTTPDLREKFLRHSANETTGGTGGSATKNLAHTHTYSGGNSAVQNSDNNLYSASNGGLNTSGVVSISLANGGSTTQDILPPYYDICYFIKVK
jgi:hypothetical protein